MVDLSNYVGSAEAARRLGCSRVWVNVLARQGRISFVQSPYGRLFEIATIDRLRASWDAARMEREAA